MSLRNSSHTDPWSGPSHWGHPLASFFSMHAAIESPKYRLSINSEESPHPEEGGWIIIIVIILIIRGGRRRNFIYTAQFLHKMPQSKKVN